MQNDTLPMTQSENTTSNGSTSFAAVTPANPAVMPGSEEARQMTVTAGRKCLESAMKCGPIGLLTKMLLGQSVTWCSTKRYLIWKASVTPANRIIYQLSPLVPSTKEKEYSLLPTPMYKDGESYYILTLNQSLKRIGKQLHWGHRAMLFYNLNKGMANPHFSLFLMGYPITYLDLEPQGNQLLLPFQ